MFNVYLAQGIWLAAEHEVGGFNVTVEHTNGGAITVYERLRLTEWYVESEEREVCDACERALDYKNESNDLTNYNVAVEAAMKLRYYVQGFNHGASAAVESWALEL